jgi:hypothetical protein
MEHGRLKKLLELSKNDRTLTISVIVDRRGPRVDTAKRLV